MAASAVLALAGVGVAVSGAPAQAAAKCYAVTCNGDDPVAEGCSADAATEAELYLAPGEWIGGGTVDLLLRYSPSCGAAWATVTTTIFGSPFVIFNNKGDYSEYTAPAGVTSWTNMIDDAATTTHAQACLGTFAKPNRCTVAW